ncbi:hypothetical protein ACFFX0_12550 [Citricoccus parietis]|uniref:Uncharacterized protein n=1 Tax=Citricoccus parietis TaxID=592307 RepID=A0ABV5FZ74_9MICC
MTVGGRMVRAQGGARRTICHLHRIGCLRRRRRAPRRLGGRWLSRHDDDQPCVRGSSSSSDSFT